MGRATPASQPPRDDARLQPGKENPELQHRGVMPAGEELLADADAALASESGWLTGPERDAARRAAESLARRMRDHEHVNELAVDGFTGPAYEIFAGELAAYGYPVILAWLRRGTIWKHCADRGRALYPTDAEREILETQFDERLDLALETVAEGLWFFRDRVLRASQWSFDGGATLTTYFVGACLLAFPNVFRRWRAAEQKWNRALYAGNLTSPEGRTIADLPGTDPAAIVAGRHAVTNELRSMPDGTGSAAALVLDGMNFKEATAPRLHRTGRRGPPLPGTARRTP
jgi:hypothetical protein